MNFLLFLVCFICVISFLFYTVFFQWKSRNQSVYSYRLREEELVYDSRHMSSASPPCPDPKPNSPQQPSDKSESQQPFDKSEPRYHQTSDGQGTSSLSCFDQIMQLLHKVEELSHSIPTTSDRMSNIYGLFPVGHGPCVEAVKHQTQDEKQYIDSFRLSVLAMKEEFVGFRSKQDAACREYEREAATIAKQIVEESVDHESSHNKLYSIIEQSGGLAEVFYCCYCFFLTPFFL